LVEQGYGETVNAVNFVGQPIEPPPLDETGKPAGDLRTAAPRCWLNLKKALEEPVC